MPKPSDSGVHLFMALIFGVSLCPGTHIMAFDSIPRRTTRIQDLLDYKQFSYFMYKYTTFWLEEEQGILYVGAREAIFALNTRDISDRSVKMMQWETTPRRRSDCLNKRGNNERNCYNYIRFLQRFNGTHLFTCGTYAFHPQCAYIKIKKFTLSAVLQGKEICPYDPTFGYTGVIVDNKIYTATLYGFHGQWANIKRNSKQRSIGMADSFTNSFNDINFVDSVLVRESVRSSMGDDDKIYFFFTEKLRREYNFNGIPLVTWVARLCKSDEGGMKLLQRKWTSFLKTRLVCSIPEFDFHFNILQSIYVLKHEHWQDTMFYGVFVSQWQNVQTSAVCQYTITDIQKAFDGPYKEDQESPRRWSRYMDEVPEPRPGSCITDEFRKAGFMTSRDLPDNVLDFVKKHPLMDEEVRPVGGRPLFTKKLVNYTKIVVDTVTALDNKQYDVMFIGTDDGWIHKVVSSGGSTHIIEEIQLYWEPQPVESLVLARAQGTLFIGSQSRVIQLPVSSCRSYPSCWDCILARDPYCGWDGRVCQDIRMQKDRATLIQDIRNGNRGCSDSNARIISRRVPMGLETFLKCHLRSNTAIVKWYFNGRELPSSGGAYYWQEGTSLVVKRPFKSDSGIYSCYAVENGISYAVASYKITVTGSRTMY